MKRFLHWSSSSVGGVLCVLAYQSHGLGIALGVMAACLYMMAAQWTEGRLFK